MPFLATTKTSNSIVVDPLEFMMVVSMSIHQFSDKGVNHYRLELAVPISIVPYNTNRDNELESIMFDSFARELEN